MSDGETRGYREAMDRLQGRMVKSGMPAREAAKKARDTARLRDRKNREK